METLRLSRNTVRDLLSLRLPEEETKAILLALTPDRLDQELLYLFLSTMQECVTPLPELGVDVMDCCGTGGSGLSHFNTSTAVAFVLAAAGIPMVKFGNRAATSASGSFDFLEALGIPPEIPLDSIPQILEEGGLCFLYAPQCYPAFAEFSALRKALGVRTIFNFLGPLLNPVKPAYRLLGVSDPMMQEHLAHYLSGDASTKRALVVRGINGLDEISTDTPTDIFYVEKDRVFQSVFDPGLSLLIHPEANPNESIISGYTPLDNVKRFHAILNGEDQSSPEYRSVCLNAGAGLSTAGHCPTMDDGILLAQELIESGKVLKTYRHVVEVYDALRP